MNKLSDQNVRDQALDPTQSFIIQAPAGSGKTELLTRRILSLLATVEQPEQILALTFTRKAASEMRERLLLALTNCQQPSESVLHELAKKVMQRSEELNWQLLENPARLRIGTIDAWCHYLVGQMPLLAKFGRQPMIADDAFPLYQQAAQNSLNHVYDANPWQPALKVILQQLDNHHERVIALMIDMLSKRDQWLNIVMPLRHEAQRRALCEQTLLTIVEGHCAKLREVFPNELLPELRSLLSFAKNNTNDENSAIHAWHDNADVASDDVQALAAWQAVTELLLTQQNTYRKRVTQAQGFPAPSKAKSKQDKATYAQQKQAMTDLIAQLEHNALLQEHLATLKLLPPTEYSDAQWQFIEALLEVLPLLVAELQLVFQHTQLVDFSEISLRANQALGQLDSPSDLALRLDQALQHILIDEFQDTSQGQLELLVNLTKGWSSNDGRTLFLVGDPMQSIYRFRQADVSIFTHVQAHGIGAVKPEPLTLKSNFRSQAHLVDWTNQQFKDIFPTQIDEQLGAIPYSFADAIQPAEEHVVTYHRCLDAEAEASQVVQLAKQAKAHEQVGILVRARTHLNEITAALTQAKLNYHAVELESLAWQPVIQDLWALTRACHYLCDRIAWFSILRAPWCGLTLQSLHQQFADAPLIWPSCLEYEAGLPPEEAQRLRWFTEVMQYGLSIQQQVSCRDWIETTWRALGGPNTCSSTELQHAEQFFELLASSDQQGLVSDFTDLERRLNTLYANPQTTTANIHVMTIHKSKGLEFDTVILPGLTRQARPDDHQLFYWHSYPAKQELLIAPLHTQTDPIYNYLRSQEKCKQSYEQARLFYVAVTRAKSQLHLCYHQHGDEHELKPPSSSSSLQLLWPNLAETLSQAPLHATHEQQPQATFTTKRVATVHSLQRPAPPSLQPVEMSWEPADQRLIGQLCHEILQLIANQGLEHWNQARLEVLQPAWRLRLQQMGLNAHLEEALTTVTVAIKNAIRDPDGRYILSHHSHAQNEYAINFPEQDYLGSAIIDRTFVDGNTRWIVDYKISPHDRSEYHQQLERYAKLLDKFDKLPIKLALYFPLTPRLITWEYRP